MRKRLLLFAAAAMTAISSFALEVGEYVYTPQGKFRITDATNLCTNGTFDNTDGWASYDDVTDLGAFVGLTSASENGYGFNTLQCNTFGATYGAYYKISNLNKESTYVVSFKVKASTVPAPGEPYTLHNYWVNSADSRILHGYYDASNLVAAKNALGAYANLFGNSGPKSAAGSIYEVEADSNFVSAGGPAMLSGEWQTVSYAIEGDGIARSWYLLFRGMPVGMEIADVQIQKAEKGYDDRQGKKLLGMAKAIRDCYEWSNDFSKKEKLEEDFDGLKENIIEVENATFESDPSVVTDLQSVLDDFIATYFDDYFKSCADNTYWPTAKVQSRGTTTYGDWTQTINGGRMGHYWNSKEDQLPYLLLGNFGKGYGMSKSRIEMTKTLQPGIYVWALDGQRFSQYTGWTTNFGFDFGAMRLFIGDEKSDSIAIYARDYSQGTFVVANITEPKTVSIGWECYNENYDSYTGGGSFFFYNPVLRVMLSGEFDSDQLKYWQKVKEQITKGRTELTTASNRINDANYAWGKAELQACVDTVSPKITNYESLDSVSVINDTYVEHCADSAATSPNSQMIYTVYNSAVRDILAANRKFVAVNDTLGMLATAIELAEGLLADRTYSASTEAAKLNGEIANAKALQTSLFTQDYSVENANAIKAEIEALDEAKSMYIEGMPVDAVATLVDIDFKNKAVAAEEGVDLETTAATATITGEEGTMTITNFTSGDDGSTYPSRQGVDVNGARVYDDVLVLGTTEGTVPVNIGDAGTNIFTVSFDLWLGYLTNYSYEKVGFFLKDENGENVSGLYFNGDGNVDPAAEGYDPCGLRAVGEFYAPDKSNNKNNVDNHYQDAYKHHFVLTLDYGTKTAKLSCVSPKGEFITDWTAFSAEPFTEFMVKCGYDNLGRRCWFDNLLIKKITAGPATLKGDTNGDNQITMSDANEIVNYFLSTDKDPNFPVEAADMNGDGIVTMSDANAVVNVFLSK